MTTGPLFSHADPEENSGPTVPDRDELLRRERQRRLARIEQRKHRQPADKVPAERRETERPANGQPTTPEPPGPQEPPPGFTSQRQWQQALDAASAVAKTVREAGHSATQLDLSVASMSAGELASAVVRAVLPLPPVSAVSLLWQGHQAGLSVLPMHQVARAEALLNRSPGMLTSQEGSEADPDAETAWQLYTDYERIRYVQMPVERQHQLLEYLPLSVVDDLIDAGRVSAQAIPGGGEHRLYLLARLAPRRMSGKELVTLGWREELVRREFSARLARGDVEALQDIDALKGAQRQLAVALQNVRRTGKLPRELTDQRWLWPALERLAPNAAVSLREHKPYVRWLLVRRILQGIRVAHLARLHGDERKYQVMLRTAWDNATSLEESRAPVGWEARNALAYLMVIRARRDPKYDDALGVLTPAPGQALSEDKLPQEAQLRLATNREILHTLKDQHQSTHILNPYAALGVSDGFPGWKDRWRELRRSLDADGEAEVNEAKDAIQGWERGRAPVAPFALPLMPDKWAIPRTNGRNPGGEATPMHRRTPPPAPHEQEFARNRAAQGIVLAACGYVGLVSEMRSTEAKFQR